MQYIIDARTVETAKMTTKAVAVAASAAVAIAVVLLSPAPLALLAPPLFASASDPHKSPYRLFSNSSSSAFVCLTSLRHCQPLSREAGKASGDLAIRRHLSSLNLVPLAQAWDASVKTGQKNNVGKPFFNRGREQSLREEGEDVPFSVLVEQLGCKSLDNEGKLTLGPELHADKNENGPYLLYLATHVDDLPPLAQLTVDVFDQTAITLSSTTDWSAWEQALINPAVGMYNAYANAVAYTEVLTGLRKRMRNRLMIDEYGMSECIGEGVKLGDDGYDWLAPLVVSETSNGVTESTMEKIAAQSSVILALARHVPNNVCDGEDSCKKDMEVVATIELRLQPTDAKIPFSQPWLDKWERRLARLLLFVGTEPQQPVIAITDKTALAGATSFEEVKKTRKNEKPPLRPYLCNLCVSPSLRSQGIGRALVRIAEAIAREKWGHSHIYLHVDPENVAARTLYEREGYIDVGMRWNVFWAGGASDIGYYVKVLKKTNL
mmetsp:Transcript_18435/g.38405  ORF Transcript_18435/g.38405 Transcript_18435/m.38405 type:complete len:492 (-) Transcript_18435:18-1493(-)